MVVVGGGGGWWGMMVVVVVCEHLRVMGHPPHELGQVHVVREPLLDGLWDAPGSRGGGEGRREEHLCALELQVHLDQGRNGGTLQTQRYGNFCSIQMHTQRHTMTHI